MNRRAFFVFEPLIVITFVAAISVAAVVSLGDKAKTVGINPGQHATAIMEAYVSAETDLFLPRELQARYAAETVVYQLAASAGGKDVTWVNCQIKGGPQVRLPDYLPDRPIPAPDALAKNFAALLDSQLKPSLKNVPYEFVIDGPLTVIGIPLRPEQVLIRPPPEAARRKYEQTYPSYYNPRVAFTLHYNYPLKQTYELMATGLQRFERCRQYATGDAKTVCVSDVAKELSLEHKDLLAWAAALDTQDQYLVNITHLYKMPLCEQFPLTLIRRNLPTLPQSPVVS